MLMGTAVPCPYAKRFFNGDDVRDRDCDRARDDYDDVQPAKLPTPDLPPLLVLIAALQFEDVPNLLPSAKS